jgi:uncharacterized membrane protein
VNEFDPFLRRGVPRHMSSSYNQIAGQSVERLAALSDGIFAVAMTLLVLDLRVRESEGGDTHPQ